MGPLFGRRRHHCDNSAAIRELMRQNEENHKRFLELLDKFEKSHQQTIKILNEEIIHIDEEYKNIQKKHRDELQR